MLQDGTAWFLLADGRRARILREDRRGAPLEQTDSFEISDSERYDPQDRPPRSFDRVGGGRHAMDKGVPLHEQEEQNFLRRVADRVAQAEQDNAFDHLIIAAPPRALGFLRKALSEGARSRICAESPKDLLNEDAANLRDRLREMLRP